MTMRLFLCNLLLAAMASAWFLPADAVREKRATSSILYAYGGSTEQNSIGGLPVIYTPDGLAYIGQNNPPGMTSRVNVTFSLTDGEMVATNVNNTKMYIQPNATGLNHMGFTSSPNSSQTTTGFTLYGKTLFWKSDSGSLETYFYAVPTTTDNVYNLTWGKDGGSMSGVVPVSLRQMAPSSGNKKHKQLMLKARNFF